MPNHYSTETVKTLFCDVGRKEFAGDMHNSKKGTDDFLLLKRGEIRGLAAIEEGKDVVFDPMLLPLNYIHI